MLAAMFLLVGLASVTPQLLVPLAPLLTDPARVRLPHLAATRPVLRQSMVMQAGGFFAPNAVRTTGRVHLVALGWSELGAAGLGSAGVVAALTPLTGALLSRVAPFRPIATTLSTTCLCATATAPLVRSPIAIVAGVLVMTLGALWAQVAHQVRFFAEYPADRAGATQHSSATRVTTTGERARRGHRRT